MKITKGDITIEVEPGDLPADVVNVLSAFGADTKPRHESDESAFSPKQRETYEALKKHKGGAHYTNLADEMGLESSVVNSRLSALVSAYPKLVYRIRAGVYKAASN